jgi:oxygen-dependent protoporphyrinogen oxidase
LIRGLFKGREKRDDKKRWADESIESFLRRRLGKDGATSLPLLDYVGSGVLHGIYAADASKLSIRSIFGFLWNADLVNGSPAKALLPSFMNRQHTSMSLLAERDGDSNAKHEVIKEKRLEKETADLKQRIGEEYVKEMESISVVSFPNGIQTLTDAMIAECKERGVEMQFGSKVESISVSEEAVEIKTTSTADRHDRVVLAQPSSSLEKTLEGAKLPNLTQNPSSTVAVLNLAMSPSLAIKVPPGFGYLVPRACAKEGDNPLGLLGVVFDSVAVPGQDGCTKLTMMFGGPFWKAGFGVHDLLSKQEEPTFIDKALSLLAKHLKIDDDAVHDSGIYRRLTLQKDCIVTYSPGHLGRMSELDAELQQQKRLTVVGASYTGVSLNDCVLYATRTANRLVKSEKNDEQHGCVTGLEELIRE